LKIKKCRLLLFLTVFCFNSMYASDFFYLGIPKSGTHFLQKILCVLNDGIPLKKEQYCHPDNYQREIQSFQKHPDKTFIFLIRDPRDVILSAYEYTSNEPIRLDALPDQFNYWAKPLRKYPSYLNMSDEERMLEMIRMSQENLLTGSCHIYTGYQIAMDAVKKHANVEIFYFEDLIGPQGGGDLDKQRIAITRLAEIGGFPLENVERAIDEAWGGENQLGDRTFRHGLIGRWQEKFDANLCEEFKRMHMWNTFLLFFGYETDEGWQ